MREEQLTRGQSAQGTFFVLRPKRPSKLNAPVMCIFCDPALPECKGCCITILWQQRRNRRNTNHRNPETPLSRVQGGPVGRCTYAILARSRCSSNHEIRSKDPFASVTQQWYHTDGQAATASPTIGHSTFCKWICGRCVKGFGRTARVIDPNTALVRGA